MVRIVYVRLGLENHSKTFLARLPVARRASPASPAVYAESAVFALSDLRPNLGPVRLFYEVCCTAHAGASLLPRQ